MIKAKNRNYIEDLSYDNIEDFLHDISYGGKLYKILDDNYIFRGHSTEEYQLISLVQRTIPYFEQYGYKKDISKEFFSHTEFSQVYNEYLYLKYVTRTNYMFLKLEGCEKHCHGIFRVLNSFLKAQMYGYQKNYMSLRLLLNIMKLRQDFWTGLKK